MAKKPRAGRHGLMDDALAKALATAVPDKDSGPDPDDIRIDQPAAAKTSASATRALEIELDAGDWRHLDALSRALREAVGVELGHADVLRVALEACPIDDPAALLEAYERCRNGR